MKLLCYVCDNLWVLIMYFLETNVQYVHRLKSNRKDQKSHFYLCSLCTLFLSHHLIIVSYTWTSSTVIQEDISRKFWFKPKYLLLLLILCFIQSLLFAILLDSVDAFKGKITVLYYTMKSHQVSEYLQISLYSIDGIDIRTQMSKRNEGRL